MVSRAHFVRSSRQAFTALSILTTAAALAVAATPYVATAAEMPSTKVVPAAGAGAIIGRIEPSARCLRTPARPPAFEAFLSQGNILLYQVDVSAHGSFEFHVLPGRYDLVVISSQGCYAEDHVDVKAGNVKQIASTPVPAPDIPDPTKASRHGWLEQLIPSALADAWCPQCNMMSQYYQMQQMPMMAPQTMYWNPYGSMAYSNFGYPGPMLGPYVNGGYYPSYPGMGMGQGLGMNGGMSMTGAKPVLYLDGPEGTEVSVKVHFDERTNWLVAIPSHGEAGWHGKLTGAHILSDDAEFPYFFYDYRSDPSRFQDTAGFCTTRHDLVPRLKSALKEAGFKAKEILDFEQYWSVKIPPSDRYCVYPQTTEVIQKVMPLAIEPKPSSLTQLVFVIQTGEALQSRAVGKFALAPAQPWKAEAPRAPAAAGELRAREWGVAFLMASPGAPH